MVGNGGRGGGEGGGVLDVLCQPGLLQRVRVCVHS